MTTIKKPKKEDFLPTLEDFIGDCKHFSIKGLITGDILTYARKRYPHIYPSCERYVKHQKLAASLEKEALSLDSLEHECELKKAEDIAIAAILISDLNYKGDTDK